MPFRLLWCNAGFIGVTVLLLGLWGCATPPKTLGPASVASSPMQTSREPMALEPTAPSGSPAPPSTPKPAFAPETAALSYKAKPSEEKAASRVSAPPAEKDQKKVAVEVAFDAADLYEVLDATLFQLFDMNYILDPSIQAKVSFRAKGVYSRWEFLRLLNEVLQMSGLALVPGPGDMIKIVRKELSPAMATRGGAPLYDAGDVTRLIRLRFLAAETAANNIRPFLSPGAVVVADKASNALVITDTASNIDKAAAMLAALDMDLVGQVSWQIFPLHYAEPEKTVEQITKLLTTQGLYTRPGTDSGGFVVLPLGTINGVMVASRWPSVLDQVRRWIAVMDAPGSEGYGGIYVYFVQNGSAKELADLLTEIYGSGGSSKPLKRTASEVVVESTVPAGESGKPTSTTAKPSVTAGAQVTGDVAFIADEPTNSIVIRASEADYRAVQDVLRQLDVVPRQVLISVIIAEISLTGSVEFGIQWFLQGHWKDKTGQLILDDGTTRAFDTPLGSGSGLAATVFDGAQFLRGLVRALGKDSAINILSSPNIMASDNKEATIEVAEEVPLVTGEMTSQEAIAVSRSIQYRKTGILLKVTPHINAGGLVKLDISQEVSERGQRDEQLKTTSIVSRKVETSLVVNNGQTVVIGGLMGKTESKGESGVPGLRRIPVLKHLFGSTSRRTGRSELILFITPRVVEDRQQADAVTKEFSQKVQSLMRMLEEEGRREP